MAASSRAVGLSGSRAGGRLPNFIRHAISNNLALVALRFDPEIKIGVPSANPSGAPRPTRTTGSPLSTALAMCFWRACEVIEPYGTWPSVMKPASRPRPSLCRTRKARSGSSAGSSPNSSPQYPPSLTIDTEGMASGRISPPGPLIATSRVSMRSSPTRTAVVVLGSRLVFTSDK